MLGQDQCGLVCALHRAAVDLRDGQGPQSLPRSGRLDSSETAEAQGLIEVAVAHQHEGPIDAGRFLTSSAHFVQANRFKVTPSQSEQTSASLAYSERHRGQ
jgi:hypothetical protein